MTFTLRPRGFECCEHLRRVLAPSNVAFLSKNAPTQRFDSGTREQCPIVSKQLGKFRKENMGCTVRISIPEDLWPSIRGGLQSPGLLSSRGLVQVVDGR